MMIMRMTFGFAQSGKLLRHIRPRTTIEWRVDFDRINSGKESD